MKMILYPDRRFTSLVLILLCLIGVTNGHAQTAWKGTCNIKFSGTSTLHDFSGVVAAEPFAVTISGIGEPATAGLATTIKVKAAKMDTDEEKRDAKMHKSMDVETHNEITVTLPKDMNIGLTNPATEGEDLRPTQLPFILTLMGKEQKIVGTISDWKYADGMASFTISFPVSLKASGIKVPAVLGVVRVGDNIDVEAKITLRSPQSSVAG